MSCITSKRCYTYYFDIEYLDSNVSVLNVNTSGIVRYHTKTTTVNSNSAVILIEWPSPSTHEFSGYFITQYTDVITIVGANGGVIRMLNGILSNPFDVASYSINNTTGSGVTLITPATIATNVLSIDVTPVPATAFTQDANVF